MEAVPSLRRVGVHVNPNNPNRASHADAVRRTARTLKADIHFAEAAHPDQLEAAIARLAKQKTQALVVTGSGWFTPARRQIVSFASRQGWPVAAGSRDFADGGALLTYGLEPTLSARTINMKAAKALGLSIPQDLLLRADPVLE